MEIRNIQYRLRRRRLDEVFDFALLVIRTHFGRFVAYSAPLLLLFVGFNVWLLFTLDIHGGAFFSGEHLGMLMLVLVEQSLFALPLVLLNGNLVFDSSPSRAKIFSGTRGLLGRYLLRCLVLRTSLYSVLAPTLVALWRGLVHHFFLPEVILLERLRGADINRRLGALARGRSDRTLAFLILDVLLALFFLLCATYAYQLLTRAAGLQDLHPLFEAQLSLLSPVAHLFVFIYAIFHSTAKFLFYLDIRSLLEGWDIELMLIKGIQDTDQGGGAPDR